MMQCVWIRFDLCENDLSSLSAIKLKQRVHIKIFRNIPFKKIDNY